MNTTFLEIRRLLRCVADDARRRHRRDLAPNPVHAALGLVLTLFGVAVQFVAQEAHFLAAVQVIVYAGAIVVLFLFVIMLLGVDRPIDLSIEPIKIQRPLAAVMMSASSRSSPLLSSEAGDAIGTLNPGSGSTPQRSRTPTSNIQQLAENLYNDHVLRVRAHVGAADRCRGGHRAADPQVAEAVRASDSEGCPHDRRHRTQLVPDRRVAPVRDRRVRLLVPAEPAHHVHVHRVDAERRKPHLRRLATSLGDINGQTAVFFVMVVAAAEVVVGLGILVSILRRRPGATADDLAELKG